MPRQANELRTLLDTMLAAYCGMARPTDLARCVGWQAYKRLIAWDGGVGAGVTREAPWRAAGTLRGRVAMGWLG